MNVLVTGSNGQLGQTLRAVSGEKDINFIFTDARPADGILPLDILDSSAVSSFITDYKIEAIVNCAGYTAVDRAENDRERCFEVNASGPACLASAIRQNNGLLIHISTDYVFGNEHQPVPLSEDMLVAPLNVYGESKLAGEREIVASGCDYVILRTAWLYSWCGNNFLNTILSKSRSDSMLRVVCDQVGSPTYALDLANVILVVLKDYITTGLGYSKSGIYHYSSEGVCSWYDFAKAICDISGANCRVYPCRSNEFVTAARRPDYSVLDKTKIKAVFGIDVPYWRDSLMQCLQKMS